MEKYELLNIPGRLGVYQIRALRNFGDIKAGARGGVVHGYLNLSHAGDCWIDEGSFVLFQAKVLDNVRVTGRSILTNESHPGDEVVVTGNITVRGGLISSNQDLHKYLFNKFITRDKNGKI